MKKCLWFLRGRTLIGILLIASLLAVAFPTKSVARSSDGDIALNAAAHFCLGYMIGNALVGMSCKYGAKRPDFVTGMMSGAAFSLLWNTWRPEPDNRELWAQVIAVQIGVQIGLRW